MGFRQYLTKAKPVRQDPQLQAAKLGDAMLEAVAPALWGIAMSPALTNHMHAGDDV